jgi:hypothetical protein
MSTNENEKKANSKADKIFDGIVEILCCSYKLVRAGVESGYYKYRENLILIGSFIFLALIVIYKKQHLKIVHLVPFEVLHVPLAKFFNSFGFYWTGIFAILGILIFSAMVAGIRTYRLHLRYQRALDHLSLKTGLGHKPKVVRVDSMDEHRTRILVNSPGIGEERYKTKLDDLRSAVGQKIESVNYWKKDNRFVEISLANQLLEGNVSYSQLLPQNVKPYSFIVG